MNTKRQFDDLLLGSIELFCLAAELASFTSAATAAGVTYRAWKNGWACGCSCAPRGRSA
jgi:hypothetical protein